MNQDTLAAIMKHHHECGGFEFTKSTVQRDEKTDERFIKYQCSTCNHEIHEQLEVEKKRAA